MGKRSTGRKIAMQALFQADAAGAVIEDALGELIENEGYKEDTASFAKALATGAWEKRKDSDKVITGLSKDWPIQRMGKVDLSILRLALFELNHEEDTPKSVVINEAVELAKKFSTPEAARFINGILGAHVKGSNK